MGDTCRADSFTGQSKFACRGKSGGKLLSRGNKSDAALAAAYFRRSPGVENPGPACEAFYNKFFVTVAPGTELAAAEA